MHCKKITATISILSTRNVPGIFGTVQTVFAVVEQQPLVSLLGSVPAHPADDVIVQDVEAGGEDGGPDEEVDGAGPKVRLAGPEAPEADGGQRHEAEVEGVVKTPVLKSTNQLKYFSPLSWY